jgi:hypothetical protein
MSTNHHTPVTTGAAANAATFNAPLSQLDTKITSQETAILLRSIVWAGKTAAPTVNDDTGDGIKVGDRWIDETNDQEYVAVDVTLGAAVWRQTSKTTAVSTSIDGLILTWNSATSITVGIGSCYAENGSFIDVTSALVKSALSLTASTWYHVYVYLSGGTPTAEVVTTAPVAWKGSAYSKTGDTTRRYVGSIKSDGSGNVYEFYFSGNFIKYSVSIVSSPFRVLSSGTATANTAISVAGCVPITAKFITIYVTNLHASVVCRVSNSAGIGIVGVRPISTVMVDFFTDNSQNIYYSNSGASGDSYVDVFGYLLNR